MYQAPWYGEAGAPLHSDVWAELPELFGAPEVERPRSTGGSPQSWRYRNPFRSDVPEEVLLLGRRTVDASLLFRRKKRTKARIR
jgi:hypothetical protein